MLKTAPKTFLTPQKLVNILETFQHSVYFRFFLKDNLKLDLNYFTANTEKRKKDSESLKKKNFSLSQSTKKASKKKVQSFLNLISFLHLDKCFLNILHH